MVHTLILKYVQDGSFDGVRNFDGKLLISLSALWKYWPTIDVKACVYVRSMEYQKTYKSF